VIIVGFIAREDWRGPYVLKGRTITSGKPKDEQMNAPVDRRRFSMQSEVTDPAVDALQ